MDSLHNITGMEFLELHSPTFNSTLLPPLSLLPLPPSSLSLSLSLSSLPLSPALSPRKLTLETMYWSVFEREEERENNGRQFVQLVQEQLTKPTAEVSPTLPPLPFPIA